MQYFNKQTISLGGSWQVQSSCGQWQFSSQVPGSVMQDLEALGAFGPQGMFWRENNRLCQDLAERDYIFSRDFEIAADFPFSKPHAAVYLECDGLDTLASISINGHKVGHADNMHRRWIFDIAAFLKVGVNHIEILFANSLAYCRQKAAQRDLWQTYWATPELAAPHFNQIRKSHCSYGWDWGPIIPDVGIWRDIRICVYPGMRLENVGIIQHHSASEHTVSLEIMPEIELLGENFGEKLPWSFVLAQALAAGCRVEGRLSHPDASVQDFVIDQPAPCRLLVRNPQLWWPNGLGKQPLYQLLLTLVDPAGRLIDSLTLSLGLRTLSLRREKDQWGESFEFICNGTAFFALGANYIPEDVCLTRVSSAKTRRLLEDCVLANFNCIRVWGGAVYPDQNFYQHCDELGLVVWQDLMFACAIYDINNPEFRTNILAEVRDNVRRIRHHASLGLICGNNEMEWGFVDWNFPHTKEHAAEYLAQYQVLFPEILASQAPQVYYWPASPSSGGDFDLPNDPNRGDCHYWDVWHGLKDFHEFTRYYFRFMSEFGFESFPDIKTVESFTLLEDRNATSPVMEDHQRCVLGASKLAAYLARYFRTPKDFASTVLVSQINQAEALRTGIEHWRRNRGRCMGSVYWQLNDNWPVSSWSSIDSAGRWKALHYTVKKAYAPLLASVAALPIDPSAPSTSTTSADSPRVAIHLSNESPAALAGYVEWDLVDTQGKIIDKGQSNFIAPPFSSHAALTLDYRGLLARPELGRIVWPNRQALLFFRVHLTEGISWYCHAFAPWKSVDLADAQVEFSLQKASDGSRLVQVQANKPALFVEISSTVADLVLDDNFVCLDSNHTRELKIIRGGEGLTDAELSASLRCQHLRQTY